MHPDLQTVAMMAYLTRFTQLHVQITARAEKTEIIPGLSIPNYLADTVRGVAESAGESVEKTIGAMIQAAGLAWRAEVNTNRPGIGAVSLN